MTDNDIIKALECCKDTSNKCQQCPLRVKGCSYMLAENALDLINRQKAEIERLRKAPKCLYEQETEYRSVSPCYNCEGAEEVRAATIKEFAEMLREELKNTSCRFCEDNVFFTIKQLVEEMVGERK